MDLVLRAYTFIDHSDCVNLLQEAHRLHRWRNVCPNQLLHRIVVSWTNQKTPSRDEREWWWFWGYRPLTTATLFISYNTNVNQELTKFETPSSSASLKFHSTSCKVSLLLLKYFSFKIVDCWNTCRILILSALNKEGWTRDYMWYHHQITSGFICYIMQQY